MLKWAVKQESVTEIDDMTLTNARPIGRFAPRTLAPYMSAAAVMLLLLWMLLGRLLALWLSVFVMALHFNGLLGNRVTDAVRIRHLPLSIAFAASSALSAWLSPYSEI